MPRDIPGRPGRLPAAGGAMPKILIVEDEEKLARFIELELIHEGYETEKAFDGRTGLELARAQDFDLILLDIMLPGLNGMEVLRRLRQEKATPVILLTARDSVMDKVAGLDAGAMDYITKPFAIEKLLARIRVSLKYRKPETADGDGVSAGSTSLTAGASARPGILRWKALELDEGRHRVTWDSQEIELTNREFLMLKTLLENRDIVLSRDTLLEKVCGYDYMGETNIVDVYVRHLRAKIDEVYGVKMLQTIRGVGYVIRSE